LGRVVQQLRRGVAPEANVLAYLPTRFVEEQTESREALKALEGLVGDRALRTRIPLATASARSLAEGAPLYDARYGPRSSRDSRRSRASSIRSWSTVPRSCSPRPRRTCTART
jgi:cellulose biosynthesis protein BcsQ